MFKKYNWHKRLIYLAQVPDLYILVVFAKLMIFQWPLYFLFLDNNDVKSFFKCSGNKNDPLSDSIWIYAIQMSFHKFFDLNTYAQPGLGGCFWGNFDFVENPG